MIGVLTITASLFVAVANTFAPISPAFADREPIDQHAGSSQQQDLSQKFSDRGEGDKAEQHFQTSDAQVLQQQNVEANQAESGNGGGNTK